MAPRFPRIAMLDTAFDAARARVNLFRSGAPDRPWGSLGIRDVVTGEVNAQLRARLAARHGAREAEVALVPGTTQANFTALAAVLDPDGAGALPGGELVIETPTYAPIVDAARALGAEVIPTERREPDGWQPDPDDIARKLGPRTRAVVLTDLHNPTGVKIEAARLTAIRAAVEKHGRALLFVDEVYAELLPGTPPPTAWAPGAPVVVTRSFTKAFGLGWARAGWALAPEPIARRIDEINVYFTVFLPAPSAAAGLAALDHDEPWRTEARTTALEGWAAISAWSATHAVPLVPPCASAPALAFLRVAPTDAAPLIASLRQASVAVAPGSLFGAPAFLRLSPLTPLPLLQEGLSLLGDRLPPPNRA